MSLNRELPIKLDLNVRQRASYVRSFRWLKADKITPMVDLTGYTAVLEVRTAPGAPGAPMIRLTTGSGITITPAEGRVEFTLPADAFNASTRAGKIGVYDLLLIAPGGAITYALFEGVVNLTPGVSVP